MRLDSELRVAQKLALSAGNSLRSFHHKDLLIGPSTRSGMMVTIADLIADDIIVSGLQYEFPHDAICSEQMPVSPDRFECDRLWLVDALDGNTNFVEHGDDYAVSIGLAIRGQAVLGVVYNPSRNELFTGIATQGTALNGRPCNVNSSAQLTDSRICTPRSDWEYSRQLDLPPVRPVVSTSYELARVAAGMDDGFFSIFPSREWSTCAGVVLVGAAGGRATLHGALEIVYNTSALTHPLGIIAAGFNLHESLNTALNSKPPPMKEVEADVTLRLLTCLSDWNSSNCTVSALIPQPSQMIEEMSYPMAPARALKTSFALGSTVMTELPLLVDVISRRPPNWRTRSRIPARPTP